MVACTWVSARGLVEELAHCLLRIGFAGLRGARALGQLLRNNTSLKRLYLADCGLVLEGVFAWAVRSTRSLIHSSVLYDRPGMPPVIQGLRMNSTLVRELPPHPARLAVSLRSHAGVHARR